MLEARRLEFDQEAGQLFVDCLPGIGDFQSDYIRQALAAHDGNWAATARTLGLDAGNLHRLARRLALK